MTRRVRRQQRRRRQIASAVVAGAVTAVLATVGALGGMAARQTSPTGRTPSAGHPSRSSLLCCRPAQRCRHRPNCGTRSRSSSRPPREQAVQQVSRDSIWDRIAACETQGNWSMRGPSFSGGVGFANSTWSSFGGTEFAANAGDATREQQIVVADASAPEWGCARGGAPSGSASASSSPPAASSTGARGGASRSG